MLCLQVLLLLLLLLLFLLQLLLSKPMDLKAAMQAISGGASPQMASIIITAMKMSEAANGELATDIIKLWVKLLARGSTGLL
jgi:hypothetical protein